MTELAAILAICFCVAVIIYVIRIYKENSAIKKKIERD